MKTSRPGQPPPANAGWAYFLDLDGTLINLADTPQTVLVERSLLHLIEGLHRDCRGAVALVSGRMIADLQNLIDLPQLPMTGLHGLERRDSSGRVRSHAPEPTTKANMLDALAPIAARHCGLLLEDKGLTLALHYRMAPALASYVHRIMRDLLSLRGTGMELQRGKCVVEIKPAGFDKGTAVAEYLAEEPFRGRRPVFIGDDFNDEHGFAEVNRHDGVSVKVGRGASCARYRLPDVAAVRLWLGGIRRTPLSPVSAFV